MSLITPASIAAEAVASVDEAIVSLTAARQKILNLQAAAEIQAQIPSIREPVITFQMALLTAGYVLTLAQMEAYNDFVNAGIGDGWWDKLRVFGTFEGPTVPATRITLVGPPLTSFGMTDAMLLPHGGTNVQSLGYYETFNLNTCAQQAHGLAVFVSGQSNADRFLIGGPASTYIVSYGSVGKCKTYSGAVPSLNENGAASPVAGLIHLERRSVNDCPTFLNGLLGQQGVLPAGVLPSQPIRIASGAHLFAVTFGTFTNEEALSFSNAVRDLVLALNRPVRAPVPMQMILFTGQSLGNGSDGSPALSTSPAYANLAPMNLNTTGANGGLTMWGRRSEAGLETPQNSFQATLAMLAGQDWNTAVANWSIGGVSMLNRNKDDPQYLKSIESVWKARIFSAFTHTGFKVPCLVEIGGESDALYTGLKDVIGQFQSDYEYAINNQVENPGAVPLFLSQISAFNSGANNYCTCNQDMVAAMRESAGRILVSCAKYFLPHHLTAFPHLTNLGYQILGAYYAKAVYRVLALGELWSPLQVGSVTRTGAVVTTTLIGAVDGVVIDPVAVLDPGNSGVEWFQQGGTAQTIASVAVSGSQIITTLTGDPGTPPVQRWRYAYTGTPGAGGGPTRGPRGCIRDNDPTVSYHGAHLYNWLLHSDEPVTMP